MRVQTNYYAPTFDRLHALYGELFTRQSIERPKAIRSAAIQKHVKGPTTLGPDEAFGALTPVLHELETHMASVLRKHSCFFWIHLYRRIGVYLSDKHGNNTGPMTLSWVRAIAEQAIFKYGRLSGRLDVKLADEVGVKSILGGEFVKSLERWPHLFHKLGGAEFVASVTKSRQWVMTDFRVSDLAAIYLIEGLAYQYWHVNAKQRAAGKGISIAVGHDGSLQELWTPDEYRLIENYDARIEKFDGGIPTNVGSFAPNGALERGSLISFVTNVARNPLPSEYGAAEDPLTRSPLIPNFSPILVNLASYYAEHAYLEKAFAKRNNFGLKELCVAALSISGALLFNHLKHADTHEFLEVMMNPMMRGYLSPRVPATVRNDISAFIEHFEFPAELGGHQTAAQLDRILDFLSLTPEKQSRIGLWSLGPRFVAIPYGHYMFYDMSAWVALFQNLFFGMRNYDPAGQKGPRFEDVFAQMARDNGLDVLFRGKELKIAGGIREIDVGIRVADRLFVCECRAAERPLDYEVGNPKTIRKRTEDLDEKVSQALSLCELLKQHPVGANYDVGWATDIIALVISPFTEWIWTLDERLFVSLREMQPRILSAFEAIEFMNATR